MDTFDIRVTSKVGIWNHTWSNLTKFLRKVPCWWQHATLLKLESFFTIILVHRSFLSNNWSSSWHGLKAMLHEWCRIWKWSHSQHDKMQESAETAGTGVPPRAPYWINSPIHSESALDYLREIPSCTFVVKLLRRRRSCRVCKIVGFYWLNTHNWIILR